MRHKTIPLLFATALMFFGITSADAAILITVNENGQGTFNDGSVILPLTAITTADPGPGGLAAVLTYDLGGPPSLVPGDVLLRDGPGGPISDLIRFNPADPILGYPASLLFYSSSVGGFDSVADTISLPGSLYANNLTILELTSGGVSHALYVPTAGNPGFVAGLDVTYQIISDTPEPGTFILAGIGIALVAFVRTKTNGGKDFNA